MGPNTVPPLRHSGLRISPTRARPVPFCRHGFLPEPLTAERFFVACVPRRSAVFSWTTASEMRSVFTRPPKISSLRSRAPTVSFLALTMSTFMALFLALLRGSGGLFRDGYLSGLLGLRHHFLLRRDPLTDAQGGAGGAPHPAADQHHVLLALPPDDLHGADRDP